jgi:hypothetical protein
MRIPGPTLTVHDRSLQGALRSIPFQNNIIRIAHPSVNRVALQPSPGCANCNKQPREKEHVKTHRRPQRASQLDRVASSTQGQPAIPWGSCGIARIVEQLAR